MPVTREVGPDFVGVGCHKSGSSWVGYVLDQHPQIYMKRKELAFFTRYYRYGYRWYDRQFAEKHSRLAGEITPDYLVTPKSDPEHKEFYPKWNPRNTLMFWRRPLPSARDELHDRYPGIRVFAIFRNPIDRAWSHYWYWRRRRERNHKRIVAFQQMFADDGRWIRTHGYYARHLGHWREKFPNFGVFFYDELLAEPAELAARIYRFLDVDDAFVPTVEKTVNPTDYEPMPSDVRDLLCRAYRDDIEKFSTLVDRDLSHWLD